MLAAHRRRLFAFAAATAVAGGIGLAPAAGAGTPPFTVSPGFGPVGTVVTVSGSGVDGATEVDFNGVAAAPTAGQPGTVTATVPAGATSGTVVVRTPSGDTPGPSFTVQQPTALTLAGNTAAIGVPHAVRLTAHLTSAGSPVAGRVVSFWHQPYGAAVPRRFAAVVTSGTGVASVLAYPTRKDTFTATHGAGPSFGASAAGPVTVAVRPLLTASVPAFVHALTTTYVTGRLRPAVAGAHVRLDRRVSGHWYPQATAVVDRTGAYRFPLRFAKAGGSYTYRVARAATAAHLAASTPGMTFTVINRDLSSGMTGSDVKAVQQRLANLHYDIGAVDGGYGFDMVHAVTAFEKVNGLPRDGRVGPQVWARLSHPLVPHLRHPTAGNGVEVDIAHQVVLFQTNGVVKIILDSSTGSETYYTSQGKTSLAHTPRGHWSVQYKVNHLVVAPLGTLYRPAYFNYDGYAIHGEDLVPPFPASHGCVRITVPAMDRMYNRLTVGLSVWIY